MRPLDLGQTLDASIKIVSANWRTFALLVLVVAGPLQLLDLLVTSVTTDKYTVGTVLGEQSRIDGDEGTFLAGRAAVALLTVFAYLLGTVACFRAVVDAHLGRTPELGASLRFAVQRLGATLWLAILFTAGLVLGFLVFVVPGVWLAVAWSVAFPVLLVEHTRGSKALGRSADLVNGRWWATLGRFFVAYILVYVVTTAATLVLLLPALEVVDKDSFGALAVLHLGNLVGQLLTTPLLAAVTVLVYFDLRARKEGLDLADVAGGMGVPPPPGPPPPTFHGGFTPPVAPDPQPPDGR